VVEREVNIKPAPNFDNLAKGAASLLSALDAPAGTFRRRK
jgi:hypothetical protein